MSEKLLNETFPGVEASSPGRAMSSPQGSHKRHLDEPVPAVFCPRISTGRNTRQLTRVQFLKELEQRLRQYEETGFPELEDPFVCGGDCDACPGPRPIASGSDPVSFS